MINSSMTYENELISPINGYKCKRITKQNIKFFGFETVESLHKQYPDLPLMCNEYKKKNEITSKNAINAHKEKQKIRRKIQEKEYDLNPTPCKYCGANFNFDSRNKVFCNSSCAANFNNNERKTWYKTSKNTKHKISNSLRKLQLIKYETNPKKCKYCGTELSYNNRKRKSCSSECANKLNGIRQAQLVRNRVTNKKKLYYQTKKFIGPKVYYCKNCKEIRNGPQSKYCGKCITNIRHYRSLCEFKFNVFDFPNEFDLSLITTFGWFSPNGYKRRNKQPNLHGVSRDHLYTILDGFTNNIDPNILKHPANCQILIHNGKNGNNSKNRYSTPIAHIFVPNYKFVLLVHLV